MGSVGQDNTSDIDYEWRITPEVIVDVRQRPFVFMSCLLVRSCCYSLRNVAALYVMMRECRDPNVHHLPRGRSNKKRFGRSFVLVFC